MISIKECNRRYGRFKIPIPMIDTDYLTVQQVFQDMQLVVVEATAHYATNCIEYTAISPLFDKTKEYENIPAYNINVSKTIGGTIAIQLEKQDG